MMTIPDAASEIRSELQRYLRGDASLNAFVARFTEGLWQLDEQQDDSIDDLAFEIELRLDEFSNGHWTEPELVELLRPLANTYVKHVNRPAVVMKTGTSSATVKQGTSVSFGVQLVDTADMARA